MKMPAFLFMLCLASPIVSYETYSATEKAPLHGAHVLEHRGAGVPSVTSSEVWRNFDAYEGKTVHVRGTISSIDPRKKEIGLSGGILATRVLIYVPDWQSGLAPGDMVEIRCTIIDAYANIVYARAERRTK